jgi:glycosyltransferase involved in cell wall biosynthesis
MSSTLHWLSPGDPDQRTGGYLYNARMVRALRERGWSVKVHPLPGEWPWPRALGDCERLIEQIPAGERVLADGLLWPGLGALRQRLVRANPVVVLVHSLLDKELAGGDHALELTETEAIGQASAWAATSPSMARLLTSRLGKEGATVCPGTDSAERAPGSQGHQLLTVANLAPNKQVRELIEVMDHLRDTEWRLDIAGSLDQNPGYSEHVRQDIARAGLEGRVHLLGSLDREALEAVYQRADIMVHMASFEAFGMGLAEAVARGIPVLSTPAGAHELFPNAAYETVVSGDAIGTARALDGLLGSPERQHRMGDAAWAARLPSWPESAQLLEAVLEGLG